jgi:hypothetical protein
LVHRQRGSLPRRQGAHLRARTEGATAVGDATRTVHVWTAAPPCARP